MSAYRNDLDALEARQASLAGEVAARQRELHEVARLIEETRARRAEAEARVAEHAGRRSVVVGRDRRRRRRRAVALAGAAAMLLAAAGALGMSVAARLSPPPVAPPVAVSTEPDLEAARRTVAERRALEERRRRYELMTRECSCMHVALTAEELLGAYQRLGEALDETNAERGRLEAARAAAVARAEAELAAWKTALAARDAAVRAQADTEAQLLAVRRRNDELTRMGGLPLIERLPDAVAEPTTDRAPAP